MKIVEKTMLREGYGTDGLSVVLVELDRYSELNTYKTYQAALEDYKSEISSFEKGGSNQ